MQDNTTALSAANLNKFVGAGDYDASEKRICYGSLIISGGTPSLAGEIGLQSVSKVSTGIYSITFSSNMGSNTTFTVTATNSGGSGDLLPIVSTKQTTGFRIHIYKISTGAPVDDDTIIDIQIVGS